MDRLLSALQSLKGWQIAVLLVVLFGIIGAVYGVYALVAAPKKASLGENQQLVPAQYGNLVNQVSTSGSLAFPNRETLTFDTQGTVAEVLVAEGQQVKERQLLARLDSATVASLGKAVAQAQASLRSAEEALAKAKEPYTGLQIAQAEAKVVSAKLSLRSAEDTLAGLLEPSSEEVAKAQAAVTSARLSVKSAEEALAAAKAGPTAEEVAKAQAAVTSAKLSVKSGEEALAAAKAGPTAEEVAKAQAAVTSARLSVKSAEEALAAAKAGPTAEELAKAQAQVESATTSLANAQADLKLTQKDWDGRVQAAQDALATALEGYQAVFKKWLGIELNKGEADLSPDALLESWGIDLASLFAPALRFQDFNKAWLAQGPPPDDPATRWSEVVVYVWLNYAVGGILPTCEDGVVPREAVCIKKEMDDAWESYQPARDNMETVQTQAAKAVASAESAVTRAEETLATAQESLADLQQAADPLVIENKQNQLEVARVALKVAEENLAKLTAGPDLLAIESKENQLQVARATLKTAEENLAKLTAGSDLLAIESKENQLQVARATLKAAEENLAKLIGSADPLEVEAKRKQVSVAQLSLADAEEELAELQGSADPVEVALREAELASAKAALETASQRLERANLHAPMAGVVSKVNVTAGQTVNANTSVVEIVDSSVVEMAGVVDEIDVLYVQKGARATVTMDALSGQTLEGTVSAISLTAQSQQGVVSYPIRIRLAVPQGLQLSEGLSATASIIIREEKNVLMVPIQALYGSYQQPIVRVMNNGRVEERSVVLGNNDGYWIVVQQGLNQGETVVMESTQATTSQFMAGRFMQVGGFPGTFSSGPSTQTQQRQR